MGRAEGKKPLGRPRRRLKYQAKTDLREVRSGSMERSDLVQDKTGQVLVNMQMNLWVP